MAIALWCLKNGTQPLGNNNYGKDVSENLYKAVPTYKDGEGRICKVATGTGPIEWSHDRTLSGIWDLNGNVWEWNGGVRFVKGELQVISNDGLTFGNDAADTDNSLSVSSALWRAIDGTTGALIAPNGTGTTPNSLKIDWVSGKWKWITGALTSQEDENRNCSFESITVDETVCETAQHKLQALGMYKTDTTSGIYNDDNFWCNNVADERAFFAGGGWDGGALRGIFAGVGGSSCSDSRDGVGFRSAFVKLPRI